MAKVHVNYKLSEDVITIIRLYQAEKHLDIETEAVETLVREFWKNRQKPVNRFKRLIKYNDPDPLTKPLEVFATA
jgi:hypothetical protein